MINAMRIPSKLLTVDAQLVLLATKQAMMEKHASELLYHLFVDQEKESQMMELDVFNALTTQELKIRIQYAQQMAAIQMNMLLLWEHVELVNQVIIDQTLIAITAMHILHQLVAQIKFDHQMVEPAETVHHSPNHKTIRASARLTTAEVARSFIRMDHV